MTRVKRGVASHRRHKKLFAQAKGFRGKRRNTVKLAKNAVKKAGQNAYIGRRLKKRDFHQLWILRINAACRPLGIKYSRFIYGMELAGITINRKMLSELAVNHPDAFKAVVEKAKAALPPAGQAPNLEELKKAAMEKKAKKAPTSSEPAEKPVKEEKETSAAPAKKPATKKTSAKEKKE